nr:hypothetical protein BaRGS_011436 [Batillaria attramentaria]
MPTGALSMPTGALSMPTGALSMPTGALSMPTDPIKAIEEFQQQNGILLPSLKPALPFLDLHGVKRLEFHQSTLEEMRDKLLQRVGELAKSGREEDLKCLEDLLEKSFPVVKYITEKDVALFNHESAGLTFFLPTPKVRRQSEVVTKLVHMVGKSVKLYDMENMDLQLLVRMIALGLGAWDMIDSQIFREPRLDAHFFTKYLPTIIGMMVDDQLRGVMAKIPDAVVKPPQLPSELYATYIKQNPIASLIAMYYVLGAAHKKDRAAVCQVFADTDSLFYVLKQLGKDYVPNFLEASGDKFLKVMQTCWSVSWWSSPIIMTVLYRRDYFSHAGFVTIAKFLCSVGIIYAGAYCLRGIGRLTNPDYMIFINILVQALKAPTLTNKGACWTKGGRLSWKRIILFAWSIGGYSASWAAMNYPDVKFVILDATFDDIVPLAITKMPQSWKSLVAISLRTYMNLNIAEQLIK